MRRLIALELDESTTATHCGQCGYSVVYDGVDDERDRETGLHKSTCAISGIVMIDGERDEACIEAERRAARMVEIDPEDAVGVAGILVRPDMKGRGIGSRVLDAIKAHARKAGR